MLCWNIYVVALEETDRYTSKRIKAENECVNKIYCVYLHALFLFLYTYRKKGVWMRVKLVLWQGIILGWTCANDNAKIQLQTHSHEGFVTAGSLYFRHENCLQKCKLLQQWNWLCCFWKAGISTECSHSNMLLHHVLTKKKANVLKDLPCLSLVKNSSCACVCV